jgi:hypothetical protein
MDDLIKQNLYFSTTLSAAASPDSGLFHEMDDLIKQTLSAFETTDRVGTKLNQNFTTTLSAAASPDSGLFR